MLYIGIPAHNEATTIGVLLWRLRTVLADVSREYEVVVYDDASTDDTAAILAPYARVLPLTVLHGERRLGAAGATDALVRHVARTTRYPRRDGLLLLQGDFTDPPAIVPEFLRRFEGGADLIIGQRVPAEDTPLPVRRLVRAARWVLRPFVGITDVTDLTSTLRLVRISVLRDLLKAVGESPVAAGDSWAAQADFLLRAAPHARRIETIPVTPTFGVRTRETRRLAWPDALALARWGWANRGRRVAAKVIARTVETPTDPADAADLVETARPERPERRERPVERAEPRGRREPGTEGRRTEPAERPRRERRPRPEGDGVSDGTERPAARPKRGTRAERPAREATPPIVPPSANDVASRLPNAAASRLPDAAASRLADAAAAGLPDAAASRLADDAAPRLPDDAAAGLADHAAPQSALGETGGGDEATERTRRKRRRTRRGARAAESEPGAIHASEGRTDTGDLADRERQPADDAPPADGTRGDGDVVEGDLVEGDVVEGEAGAADPERRRARRRRTRRGRQAGGEGPGPDAAGGAAPDRGPVGEPATSGHAAGAADRGGGGGEASDSDASEPGDRAPRRRNRRGRRGGRRRREGGDAPSPGDAPGDLPD